MAIIGFIAVVLLALYVLLVAVGVTKAALFWGFNNALGGLFLGLWSLFLVLAYVAYVNAPFSIVLN